MEASQTQDAQSRSARELSPPRQEELARDAPWSRASRHSPPGGAEAGGP